MKTKRQRDDDDEGDEGLEQVKIKVRKRQIEKTDNKNTDSENTDSENTDSENTYSEKVDNEKIVKEKVASEKNRCAVCDSDDHSDAESCSNWGYPSTNWPTICPFYCAGTRQSPIDIDTKNIVSAGNDSLVYTNYNQKIPTANVNNNGHSATVSWDTSVNTPSISGGGLNGSYTLAQFHFHWGCENTRGSEHTVDGHSYAMEMHLVHYKTSYGSLGEAVKYSDGLAVLGLFFNVGAANPAYKPITDSLSQITEPGTDEDIVFNMTLVDLLPSNDQEFFRYEGSLTTPTCNEVVIWSVLQAQVEIDQDQIDAFRSMKDAHHASLCDNYREVQPLNGRTVGVYNIK